MGRSVARRILLLLLALALVTVAWLAARPDAPADEGLVAQVQVLDEDGAPVRPAQVERVYDQARVSLDGGGAWRA